MNLDQVKEHTFDAFGDICEYLTSNAGRSYTPVDVSELLTQFSIIGKTGTNKVYGSACFLRTHFGMVKSKHLLYIFRRFYQEKNGCLEIGLAISFTSMKSYE